MSSKYVPFRVHGGWARAKARREEGRHTPRGVGPAMCVRRRLDGSNEPCPLTVCPSPRTGTRCFLQDPIAQPNGRQGQPRRGGDISGVRRSNSKRVGVRRKQHLDGIVTEKELRAMNATATDLWNAIDAFLRVARAKIAV